MRKLFCILIIAAAVAAVAAARPKWHELEGYTFERYVSDFAKPHKAGTKEYEARKELFHARLGAVKAHNADLTHTWRKGINHLSDWTEAELKSLRGARPHMTRELRKSSRKHIMTGLGIPKSVDWRQATPAVLTAVKDQGQCGSCWAHAATETIESQVAIATGRLFTLSQQQIVSCTPNPDQCGGQGGCTGATAQLAFQYLSTVGHAQEWTYPYTSYFGNSGVCSNQTYPVVNVSGYVDVDSNDEQALLDAVANVGPISISADASNWNDYESGVYSGCSYNASITIDHAIQLVGYGGDLTAGTGYWIVRNSWSPDWGEDGYIRLQRTGKQQCGWDLDPSQGSACKNGPKKEYVCGQCGILFDNCYPTLN